MSDTFFLIVGIVLTAISVLLIVVTIMQRIECSSKTTATVVSIQKKKLSYHRGKTYYQYYPIFSYQVDGKEYNTRSDWPTQYRLKYKVGDEVIIRYNPKSPESISVGVKVLSLVCDILFAIFGIMLVVCYFL